MRLRDWEPRLVAFLAEMHRRDFAPGQYDCGVGLVAGAIEAMTGVDHGAGWRGRYKTIKGAMRLLRKAGHADHVAYVASLKDGDGAPLFREVPPAFAHKGDIAVVDGEGGPALGIVQGEGIYVLTPEKGLGVVSRMQLCRAFRV